MTETFVLPAKTKKLATGMILLGVLGIVIGFTMEHGANRVWGNLLLNTYYFLGISLVGTFLVAAHQVGYGGWHIQIKRIFEATGSYIPFLGVIMLLIVIGGAMHWHHLYHWMDASLYNPESPEYDKLLAGKQGFLNVPFFLGRIIAYIALWSFFAWLLRKVSIQEDETGGIETYKRNKVYAALFLIVFAVTSSTASWDFIMSVDPHWYSTLFGWYNFASYAVAGVSAITLIVIYLQNNGYLKNVNEDHYHNLGMFMFGFSVFWAYLWFSQFMLQWYANVPEETIYFYNRLHGKGLFKVFFYLNLFICFFFPFLFLMTRAAKRNPSKLAFAAVVLLFGHWMDYYMMVMPGGVKDDAGFGLPEIFIAVGFAGGYVLVVLNTLTKASLVPLNNPFLPESKVHHTLK